ncbi:hypothetical protein [Dietzia aerolata]|uniref:Uncharacterized protein n=1 Tax=Dietzia aerolata TaxID=595984 RepID=A0ABV5JR20_9ACTN|nr:hypothetical protein [Dietzia aerolata]
MTSVDAVDVAAVCAGGGAADGVVVVVKEGLILVFTSASTAVR